MSPRSRRNEIKAQRLREKRLRELSPEAASRVQEELDKYSEYLLAVEKGENYLETRMGHDIQETAERVYRRENPAPDYLVRKSSANQFLKGKVKTEIAEKMFVDQEMIELSNRFSMPGVKDEFARQKYALLAEQRYGIKNILDRKRGAFDWKAWADAYRNLKSAMEAEAEAEGEE